MRKYFTLLLLCAISIAGIFAAAQAIRHNRLLVEPYRVGRGHMSSYAEYSGKLEACAVENIYTDMSIYVESLEVECGQKVKKGQLLAFLDNTRLRSALYELDLEQYRTLDVASIVERYLSGGSLDFFDIPTIDIEAELGLKPQPDALYSPIDGTVLEINAAARDYTKTSKPVFVLADTSTMRVRAYVPESAASNLRQGREAVVTGSGFRGRKYTAVVSSVSPKASEIYEGATKRTAVEVLLDIIGPSNSLKPGYSANVRFYSSINENALQVPYECIEQDEDNSTFVYVLKEGRVVRRQVRTGLENENFVEITGGLSEGDYIVRNTSSVRADGEAFRLK